MCVCVYLYILNSTWLFLRLLETFLLWCGKFKVCELESTVPCACGQHQRMVFPVLPGLQAQPCQACKQIEVPVEIKRGIYGYMRFLAWIWMGQLKKLSEPLPHGYLKLLVPACSRISKQPRVSLVLKQDLVGLLSLWAPPRADFLETHPWA